MYEFLHANGQTGTSKIPTASLQKQGYAVQRQLGAGNQADVKLAVDKHGNQRCVKCYKKAAMNVGSLDDIKEEFDNMKLLTCKSIARTFEIFQDSQHVYMVNEVYWGGDLTGIQD